MPRARGWKGRRPLKGWIRWTPFLLLPFSVLFGETFLHTQRLRNDYEINRLTSEIEVVKRRIGAQRAEAAAFENKRLIDARARELQFVEPKPGQLEVIRRRAITASASASAGAPADPVEPEQAELSLDLGGLTLPDPGVY